LPIQLLATGHARYSFQKRLVGIRTNPIENNINNSGAAGAGSVVSSGAVHGPCVMKGTFAGTKFGGNRPESIFDFPRQSCLDGIDVAG